VANLPENGHAPAEPRGRQHGLVGGGEANRTYPTPSEMFVKIGATILVALCMGLAVDYLVNALTR
jgi:hypothetical protein